MCRSALYSRFAPAFRFRECHSIRPCTVRSLPLTEARLRNYRTSRFTQPLTTRDEATPNAWDVAADIVLNSDENSPT